MNQFFTPIQVSKAPQPTFDVYQVEKYSEDPFQLTSTAIQSLGDHRKKIMHWLKSMPISVRVGKLTYTNKQFSSLLIKMFELTEERENFNQNKYQFAISNHPQIGYTMNEQRLIRVIDHNVVAAEKKLLKQIMIVNCFTRFDSVAVSQALASDIDRMFDLFSIIENGVSHELTQFNYKNYESVDSHLLFFNPQEYMGSTKSLCSWFVEVIKKTVSLKYFQEVNVGPEHSFILNNELTFYQEKPKKFRKKWRNMNKEARTKLVDEVFSKNVCLIVNDYRHNIHVCDHSFPKIRFSNPQKIKAFKAQIIQCGEMGNDGNIFGRLVNTRLEETLQELATYKYELLIDIEQIMERQQRFIMANMKKKQQKKTEETLPKGIKVHNTKNNRNQEQFPHNGLVVHINYVNQPIKQPKKQQTKKEHSHLHQSLSSDNIRQEIYQRQYEQMGIRQTNNRLTTKKEKKIPIKEMINQQVCVQEKELKRNRKQMSQTTNDADEDENQVEENTYIKGKQMNRSGSEKIDEQKKYEESFNNILNQLREKSNSANKMKKIAIQRISTILQTVNLSFQIYGSYACGLSLPSSDIDISIDPTIIHYFYASFCSYRQKIIMALDFLSATFSREKCVSNINLITTASIPLLTFDLDLSVPFGNPNNHNISKFRYGNNQWLKVSFDLTIKPFANMIEEIPGHLGYQSTALVSEWLSQHEKLSGVVLILKHLLAKKKLNKPFTGGMSSFCLIVWIVSFLQWKKNSLPLKESSKELLIEFCSFASKFNNDSLMVDLHQQDNPIPKKNIKNLTKIPKLIILNPLNNKNLSENCCKIEQIKDLLGLIFQQVACKDNKTPKQYKKSLRRFLFQ